MSMEDRFWARVARQDDGCWRWTGGKVHNGYATLSRDGHSNGAVYAHRYAYELLVGPIPEGLDLDHLCRVRDCVNPAHLEPVTRRENLMRGQTIAAAHAAKTRCHRGHPFDDTNTYRLKGGRWCRTCGAERARRYRREKQAAL